MRRQHKWLTPMAMSKFYRCSSRSHNGESLEYERFERSENFFFRSALWLGKVSSRSDKILLRVADWVIPAVTQTIWVGDGASTEPGGSEVLVWHSATLPWQEFPRRGFNLKETSVSRKIFWARIVVDWVQKLSMLFSSWNGFTNRKACNFVTRVPVRIMRKETR